MRIKGMSFVWLLALVGFCSPHVCAAEMSPLERVSPDSAVLIHLRAGSLWDHPMVGELRKQFAKPLEQSYKELETNIGLLPDQLSTVTLNFPKMPQGPGDEQLLIAQFVTKTPYDKTKLLKSVRSPKEMIKDDAVPIDIGASKFQLHFTSATQFTILHPTLVADFVKGPAKNAAGAMTETIKLALDPANTLTFGLDPTGLPNEIFTAAPAELQPFLPLLKTKSIMATLSTDKNLGLKVRFLCDNADKTVEAERSLSLLKKLAETGLTEIIDDKQVNEDVATLIPIAKKMLDSMKAAELSSKNNILIGSINMPADSELIKPLIASVARIRDSSSRSVSSNNLKQLALSIHNYHDAYGRAPSAAIVDKKGKALLSWRVSILPFIEGDQLYKEFKLDEPWDSEHNKKLIEKMPRVFASPYGEPKKGETNYLAFVGTGALFNRVQGFQLARIPDGTSNTILFVESSKSVIWTKPDDIDYDPKKPVLPLLQFQQDVCLVAFADGSVRAVSKKVEEKHWHWYIQPADGNVVPTQK